MSLSKQHLLTFVVLLLLLGVTVAAACLPIGSLQLPLALLISIAKAALIILIFMRLPSASGIARLAFAAGFLWLLILAALSLGDFLTRS
jgi:cytochrome c oxidase subunit IV